MPEIEEKGKINLHEALSELSPVEAMNQLVEIIKKTVTENPDVPLGLKQRIIELYFSYRYFYNKASEDQSFVKKLYLELKKLTG
ncbi:MAG: hypothetical protein E6767_20855 [Dysgonomonas sp.]|nr:hypothetical protein [Dysgonomonas sp.]